MVSKFTGVGHPTVAWLPSVKGVEVYRVASMNGIRELATLKIMWGRTGDSMIGRLCLRAEFLNRDRPSKW